MTLIQIEVEDDEARCAVDTRITRGEFDGLPMSEASKLCAIPHAGCLVASRGGIIAFACLSSTLMGPLTYDFDSIVENISTEVGQIAQGWPASGVESKTQTFIIGWSAAAGRMEVASFEIDLRRGEAKRVPVPRCLIAPPYSVGAGTPFSGLATDDAMRTVAERQLQWMAENSPAELTGGRLLVAEVARHEIRMHDAGPIAPERR